MVTENINSFATVVADWTQDYVLVSVGGTVGPRKALLTAAGLGVVPETRTVIAGANLTGGGALTANITLNVAASPTFTNVTATSFIGSGASLTGLNADNITAGTLDHARLSGVAFTASSNVFDLGQSFSQGIEVHGTSRQLGPIAFGLADPANMPAGLAVLNADASITTLDKATATLSDVIDAVAVLQRQFETRGLCLPVAATPVALFVAKVGYLWQDAAGTIPATTAGDRVGRWDSAIAGLPYATQATAGLRPVLALDGSGRLEVRDSGSSTSFLTLSTPLALTDDCTLYARGTQTEYSKAWVPFNGADYARNFIDNQNYLTAAAGSAIVMANCVIKGQLKVRWRRASGTAYLMARGTTEIIGVNDSSMGSLAGTITFASIAGINNDPGNGVSMLVAYARNLSLDDRAKTDLAVFGTIQN